MQTDKQTEELFSQAESFSNSKVGRAGWALIICQLSLFPSKWHRIVAIMAVVLSSSAAWAQTTQIFNASGTFTCPAGVTTLTVECWGGGGAGGSAQQSSGSGAVDGGGGAGGAYIIKSSITVIPGNNYTVTVGAGGTADISTSITDGDHGDGGDSWFNTAGTVLAKGGGGGISRNAVGGSGGNGGACPSGSIGDTINLGGSGAAGIGGSSSASGGGGGSGGTGTSNPGNPASGKTGGMAVTGGGAGASGRSSGSGSGTAGSTPGGGGSGAQSSSTGQQGGAGAAGKVAITYTVDEYWRTDGTTGGNWNSTFWNAGSANATGGTGWTAGNNALFTANSTLTFASATVGNVTVSANKTVTVTAGGTLTLASPSIFDIGSGATLTWQSQSITANSAGGITKNSAGTLDLGALAALTTLTGGFILNAGTVIVSGTKSFGTAAMTINGGTIQSSGSQTFTPTSLTIGGDFSFAGTGNDFWSPNVSLGASTRSIANNTTGTAARTFSGVISGASGAGLTFTGTGGSGGIVLNNADTYTGDTTISAGLLKLGASGSISNSPNIIVNGTFDVSAVSGFTIGASQTLKGSGTVNGAATVNGILSPGNSSIATLTFGGALALGGTAAMSINKATGPIFTADKAAVAGTLTYGGSLTVTASGSTLASGDSYTLFSAGIFSGWFSTLNLPTLASGLSWDTNTLRTSGVLNVYAFITNSVQTMSAIKNTSTTLLISKLLSKASSAFSPVVLSSVSSASGAMVAFSGNNINYTPPSGFTGVDTFSAVLSDGHGSITATVVVTVNAINAGSYITLLDNTSDPGHVILTASGMPTTPYRVQISDDSMATWSDYDTKTSEANGVLIYKDLTPNYPSRFYRLAQ